MPSCTASAYSGCCWCCNTTCVAFDTLPSISSWPPFCSANRLSRQFGATDQVTATVNPAYLYDSKQCLTLQCLWVREMPTHNPVRRNLSLCLPVVCYAAGLQALTAACSNYLKYSGRSFRRAGRCHLRRPSCMRAGDQQSAHAREPQHAQHSTVWRRLVSCQDMSFSDQKNRHRPDHRDIDNVRAPCCVG